MASRAADPTLDNGTYVNLRRAGPITRLRLRRGFTHAPLIARSSRGATLCCMSGSRARSGSSAQTFEAAVYVLAVALAFISLVLLVGEIASLAGSIGTLVVIGGSMFAGVLAAAAGSALGRLDERRVGEPKRAKAGSRRTPA